MELLREKGFITIWYDPRHFIRVEWRGYYSPAKIKDGSTLVLECFAEKKCTKGLNDARLGRGTFLQAADWFREYFFPKLVDSGIEKVAFLNSYDFASRMSLQRILELSDQYEAQVFDDLHTAESWLLGEIAHLPPNQIQLEGRLVIREKEKFIFLDFSDIMYVFSFEKGTALQCTEETHYAKLPLKEILAQLPDNFIQIHRSYIVNSDLVSSIKYHNSGSYNLYLKELPRVKIPVSKKYVPWLKSKLNL